MKPENAKTYTKTTWYFAAITAAVVSTTIYFSKGAILSLYNIRIDDETDLSYSVEELISKSQYLVIGFIMWNSVREVLEGPMRGLTEKTLALTLFSIGVLIIGLPLQTILFVKMEQKFFAIWFGLNAAMAFVFLSYFFNLMSHDYEMSTFRVLQNKEEVKKKEQTVSALDNMLSYKAPPKKINPY